ncbi:MAG: arginine--tRNA ligase [Mariprofundaceae bacterium]|nr:arginine--tRNA ligase [Mariprofundaceae bacterium]
MKQSLEHALQHAVDQLLKENSHEAHVRVQLTRPKQKEHGDYAANVAMSLAGHLNQSPRAIAEKILSSVKWPDAVDGTDIAGPGFINIRLKHASEADVIKKIVRQGEAYGRTAVTEDAERINLEFVSANPTGPMHVGHGRGAVVGDSLGRILSARGYNVHREYYINDAGAQIGALRDSLWFRLTQKGLENPPADDELPEHCYPGDYMKDVADRVLEKHPFAELAAMDEKQQFPLLTQLAIDCMMEMIRNDLAALGISFDHYFSERSLHESGRVAALIEQLKTDDLIYLGTLPPPKGKEVEDYQPVEQWLFRTTRFGDDIDRPLAKKDGTPTYFAADIAYHVDKFERGFKRQVNIWGADHGGYVTRVQSALKALTGLDGQPEVLLVQMVNLTRGGEQVKMSKRAGTFVTLREVVDEVGADAVRFNFMTRRVESQLDFDLEMAKQKSDENPVYYVQYAYARVCAILRKAEEDGVRLADMNSVDASHLTSDEEKKLLAQLLAYPELLERAAARLEAYQVATYLMKLAQSLHGFYHKHRVISGDESLTQARLLLIKAIGQVICNGLSLLGVSAPERM